MIIIVDMNSGKIIRCFIALGIPVEIQAILNDVVGQMQKSGADVRWVDSSNIHLTLKFLGELPPAAVREAGLALKSMEAEFKAIDSGLGRLGAFPSLDRPKVIWIGLAKGGEELKAIQRQVENLTADISEEERERTFSPHLTLGRVRSGKRLGALRESLRSVTVPRADFRLSKLMLVQSTLAREGAIYHPLWSVALG